MAINFLNTIAVDDNVLFVDTINDRVGIGTDSPSYNFVVGDGTTDTESRFYHNDASYTSVRGYGLFMSRSNSYIRPVNDGSQTLYIGTSSNTWGTFSADANVFSLNRDGASRLYINSSGNVGIGTTNPAKKIHVLNSTNEAQIRLGQSGSGSYDIGVYANDTFSIGRDSDTQEFNIKNGNVGIGTTSPGANLAGGTNGISSDVLHLAGSAANLIIEGSTRGQILLSDTGANSNSRMFGLKSENDLFELYSINDDLSINTDNILVAKSDGNVGIGTVSPGEKLDVNGNIKIKNALLSNQENTDIDSAAAEVVAQVAHATYTAAFFDFVVKKGTNVRSGTVYACHNGDTTPLVEFTETSTQDLGDTSDVVLSVDISGANMRLLATVASDDWSVKSLVKAI